MGGDADVIPGGCYAVSLAVFVVHIFNRTIEIKMWFVRMLQICFYYCFNIVIAMLWFWLVFRVLLDAYYRCSGERERE